MNQIESTIKNIAPAAGTIAEDFLPSLYRATLILGVLATLAIAMLSQSSIWAGSFLFGVLASLAFLKAQEMFLKKLIKSRAAQAKAKKPSKALFGVMVGKYVVLAGIMAIALRFEVLNLIAFVLGFALLHMVMLGKVLIQRMRPAVS